MSSKVNLFRICNSHIRKQKLRLCSPRFMHRIFVLIYVMQRQTFFKKIFFTKRLVPEKSHDFLKYYVTHSTTAKLVEGP